MKRDVTLFKMFRKYEELKYGEQLEDDAIMEGLLDLLEEEGMKPESYEGLMRDGRKFEREYHQGYDVMMVRDRWEPENKDLDPCGMEPEGYRR